MADEEKQALIDEINKSIDEKFAALKKDLNEQFEPVVNKLTDDVKKNADILAQLKKSNGSQQQEGQETSDDEVAKLEKEGKYKDKEGVVRKHVFV